MDRIDVILYESDIEFLELENTINQLVFNTKSIFLEGTAESASNFFDGLITKAREIVTKVKEKITEFVSSKAVESKVAGLKDRISKNPSLGNEKVKMVDYDKLDKLNDTTRKQLETSKDPEELMKKYRSQRNKILAAGAVVTVSLSAALVLITKSKNKKIDSLDASLKKSESHFNKLKKRYMDMKGNVQEVENENKKLKNKIERMRTKNPIDKAKVIGKQTSENISDTIGKKTENINLGVQAIKQTAKAETEILSNTTRDVAASIKDALSAVADKNTSALSKVGSVAKGVGGSVGAVAGLASGKTKEAVRSENKQQLKTSIKGMMDKIEKAKKIANDSSQPKERVEKAKKYLSMADGELKKMKARYVAMK